MPPTRAQPTDGRSSPATWSTSLAGATDHESKKRYLLDYDRTHSIFYRRRRFRADVAISRQPPWRRARPWLPNVLLCHPGVLEGAWSHCHTRAAFSAAQGMGVRRHLLRPDRCGRIRRCGRRLRRLRLSHPRPAHHHWSYRGIVGAATRKPYHRHPLSSEKRHAGINTRAALAPWKRGRCWIAILDGRRQPAIVRKLAGYVLLYPLKIHVGMHRLVTRQHERPVFRMAATINDRERTVADMS